MTYQFNSANCFGMQLRNPQSHVANGIQRNGTQSLAPSSLLHGRKNPSSPVAIWRMNAETGRLEIYWSADKDEIDRWKVHALFQRLRRVIAFRHLSRFQGWSIKDGGTRIPNRRQLARPAATGLQRVSVN